MIVRLPSTNEQLLMEIAMTTAKNIRWFKSTYGARIEPMLVGTPFDLDMITTLACQETGELWGAMRKDPALTPDQIAALCCGDTLDADKGRKAFPRTKADLVAPQVVDGKAMFDIARNALLQMAAHVPGYSFANTRPNKFCHGFGMFQYDLQFFLTNPRYFLDRKYENFENSLQRALGELKTGLRIMGYHTKPKITDLEFCHVAICYNTGGFKPDRGLRQGHQSGDRYYGEAIRDYLAMCRVDSSGQKVIAGTHTLPPSDGFTAKGPKFRVDITSLPLRLRSAPKVSTPPDANVIATMPDGLVVRSMTGDVVKGFMEVEAKLGGTVFHGFASAKFLVRVTDEEAKPLDTLNKISKKLAEIAEAHAPRKTASVTKRNAIATAFSLNEPNMPGRKGDTPEALRAELATIIDYLAVDKATHTRYLTRAGLTFCNIYAHDYCMLAGAYLPRVWWDSKALMRLAAGDAVPPLLGTTVYERRANDIFRWLNSFGAIFGWRRAISLEELQNHANLGGVSIIIARRREDGRSGHVTVVPPETSSHRARRNAAGAITQPLESQAGVNNFRYGYGRPQWWKDQKFAEAGFWIHP
jgi:hypothetical protein